MTTDTIDRLDPPDVAPPASSSSLRTTLISIIAIAVLAIGVAGGFYFGTRSVDTSSGLPSASSVDVGFARDMATHHQQAVTMAGYVRDNPASGALGRSVSNLAYDIETAQSVEMGTMVGWLNTWGVSRTSGTPMAWMGSSHMHMSADGLMPGMATGTQLDKLLASNGKAMDILFLQLMIRHHQGGVDMARYAVQHAQSDFVRDLAGKMVAGQTSEIITMEQMLRQLGGTPLPAPTD